MMEASTSISVQSEELNVAPHISMLQLCTAVCLEAGFNNLFTDAPSGSWYFLAYWEFPLKPFSSFAHSSIHLKFIPRQLIKRDSKEISDFQNRGGVGCLFALFKAYHKGFANLKVRAKLPQDQPPALA